MALLAGLLTKKDLARGMPCGDPIFTGPPYYWQDLERVVLSWQTDIDACRRLCPDCMEVDGSATARLILYNFPVCSLGPYHEASFQFRVSFEGKPFWFECKNIVDSDVAFAAGREVFGIPKKMGWLTWEKYPETGLKIEVGRGGTTPILSADFVWQEPFTPEEGLSSLSVRVIPTGIGGDPEIIVFNGFDAEKAVFRVGQDGYTYKGRGSLAFISRSLLDPWHELSVEKFIGAEYLGGSNYLSLGTGTVAKKY
jgi:acetoacetate decarboxylase